MNNKLGHLALVFYSMRGEKKLYTSQINTLLVNSTRATMGCIGCENSVWRGSGVDCDFCFSIR